MICEKTINKEYLYVVSCVSNPAKYKRRYQLFNEFCERMSKNPKVKLFTTELQLGCRPFVTDATFKIRSNFNLWHKENLLNYTIHRLPPEAKYIAWIDSDIEFLDPKWAEKTICKLQEHPIIQPWSECIDMGPNKEVLQVHKSFCYMYHKNNRQHLPKAPYTFPHPGYSFAFTRDILNKLGGLFDYSILGSGDHNMACAFVHKVVDSIPKNIENNYSDLLFAYENLCKKYLKKNIGYISGIISHHFHGKKKDRQYVSRWDIILKHKYDPLYDVSRDTNGILQFTENKPEFEADIRNYFYSRNEDSIDLE